MQVNMALWMYLKPNAWLIGTASKSKYKYYAFDLNFCALQAHDKEYSSDFVKEAM